MGNNLETTVFRWHYTKDNDYPDQFAECFCDTGDLHGYQTLTYSGSEFYDKECMEFDVSRWVLSSDVVTLLDRITSIVSDTDASFRKYLNGNKTDSVAGTVEMKTGEVSHEV